MRFSKVIGAEQAPNLQFRSVTMEAPDHAWLHQFWILFLVVIEGWQNVKIMFVDVEPRTSANVNDYKHKNDEADKYTHSALPSPKDLTLLPDIVNL